MLDAGTREEIQRAVQFASEHKLKGALNRAPLAGELAADVKRSGLAVIAGPFGPGTSERTLASIVALGKERVPLAFGADSPWTSDESLRLSAAMCVRAGLDAQTAWEALTSTAAQIAGAGERVGRLTPGADADFVLWSGDPLELSSRVQAVYIEGRRAFGGDE
jgi:imidazolonepropionase-like amidohydrolase